MFDVVALLGPDWKIDDSTEVTVANQMSLTNDLPDVCELKQKATKVASAWGGQPSYAPPLGWKVYWVTKPAGAGAEMLYIEDTIWVDPQGIAYSVTSCAKGVTSGEAVTVVIAEQKKKTSHTLLLLGAVGLLAYITFSK